MPETRREGDPLLCENHFTTSVSATQPPPRMQEDCTTQSVLFFPFDQQDASSDGGAILLKACDERLGLTARLAAGFVDRRQHGKIQHSVLDFVRQRLFAIACGYVDCNDARSLARDPIHKALVGRDLVTGEDLASQPTLSRFENSVTRADLYRASVELANVVVESHKERLKGTKVRKITIDLDPTDNSTHGGRTAAVIF